MITFFAFLLTIAGCVNWLMIGLLQYDFIAGLFGFQASIFSRLVYILFGVAALYLIIRVIVNKGTFKIYERKKKKSKSAPIQTVYVEAGKEQTEESQQHQYNNQNSLFEEHLNKK